MLPLATLMAARIVSPVFWSSEPKLNVGTGPAPSCGLTV